MVWRRPPIRPLKPIAGSPCAADIGPWRLEASQLPTSPVSERQHNNIWAALLLPLHSFISPGRIVASINHVVFSFLPNDPSRGKRCVSPEFEMDQFPVTPQMKALRTDISL